VAAQFFEESTVSWMIPGFRTMEICSRAWYSPVSNPGRMLKFLGYTPLSGFSHFLRKKERILEGS
jgi:hypothetical protein